jgi:hypothetical protein
MDTLSHSDNLDTLEQTGQCVYRIPTRGQHSTMSTRFKGAKRATPERACATWRLERVRRSCHVSRVSYERTKGATLRVVSNAAPLVSTHPQSSYNPIPPTFEIRSTNVPFVRPGVMLDVDAVLNDRATSTCGVSDVLSASLIGKTPAQSRFLASSLQQPPAQSSIAVSPSLSESMSQHLGWRETLLHNLTIVVS